MCFLPRYRSWISMLAQKNRFQGFLDKILLYQIADEGGAYKSKMSLALTQWKHRCTNWSFRAYPCSIISVWNLQCQKNIKLMAIPLKFLDAMFLQLSSEIQPTVKSEMTFDIVRFPTFFAFENEKEGLGIFLPIGQLLENLQRLHTIILYILLMKPVGYS